jgi:hypothetical protein
MARVAPTTFTADGRRISRREGHRHAPRAAAIRPQRDRFRDRLGCGAEEVDDHGLARLRSERERPAIAARAAEISTITRVAGSLLRYGPCST